MCRDEVESPGDIYIETDDQIHGFHTTNATYAIINQVLTICLNDNNVFYWNGSKTIKIYICDERLNDASKCLKRIFAK